MESARGSFSWRCPWPPQELERLTSGLGSMSMAAVELERLSSGMHVVRALLPPGRPGARAFHSEPPSPGCCCQGRAPFIQSRRPRALPCSRPCWRLRSSVRPGPLCLDQLERSTFWSAPPAAPCPGGHLTHRLPRRPRHRPGRLAASRRPGHGRCAAVRATAWLRSLQLRPVHAC